MSTVPSAFNVGLSVWYQFKCCTVNQSETSKATKTRVLISLFRVNSNSCLGIQLFKISTNFVRWRSFHERPINRKMFLYS